MRGERWRPVVGYEGLYKVSNLGRILSSGRFKWNGRAYYFLPGRVLSPGTDSGGYQIVVLCGRVGKRSLRVHTLVMDAFAASSCDCKREINHLNGDKSDNRRANLERCSRSQNMKHAYKIGLR